MSSFLLFDTDLIFDDLNKERMNINDNDMLIEDFYKKRIDFLK